MAKLGAYFGLCPLIDHRSLLGVSEDEEQGVAIVTLGKNIAIKFKVADQKQLHSWRTKDKFTSPIVYDKEENKYVAAFNQSYIRMWSGNEEFVDKLKKYKFNCKIHTLLVCQNRIFVIFTNGNISLLKTAIENRHNLKPQTNINTEFEYISNVHFTQLGEHTYIGLVIKSDDTQYLLWTCFNEAEDTFFKIPLVRSGHQLTGSLFHLDNNTVKFFSLWSDGHMRSLNLTDAEVEAPGELFCVIESISCKDEVSIVDLDENYIALYGCNSNEEGALLAIYNVQFKVIQSQQTFKLFTRGAKLWALQQNLFITVAQYLAVIPYHLALEQLAALVGSHKLFETDIEIIEETEIAQWGAGSKKAQTKIPSKINKQIAELVKQGLPENLIFDQLLSDFITSKNYATLPECLEYFSDVPEKSLVKILKCVLSMKTSQNSIENLPERLQSLARLDLIDLVFSKTFSEMSLLPILRKQLSVEEALTLLQYVLFLLSDQGHCLPGLNSVSTDSRLIEWGCIILDSNYQKILLTKDDSVKEVLSQFQRVVKFQLKSMQDMKKAAIVLEAVKSKKQFLSSLSMSSRDYNVEEISLY